ncbi:MAG: MATE family efflux transporter [Bacteroidales bacterium]|nr:MATE family efflux transporter [Bacteroidales bacterium]
MNNVEPGNKRIAKNTLFLYLRTGLTMLVALYTSRVVLNALGVEDFGIWGVIGGLVSMFGFINSSLSSSIFRFLTYAIGTGDTDRINKTYNASIVIHVILSIIIFILCESLGQWFLSEKLVVPEAKREIANIVFHIVILTSCISLLNVPFNSVIIAYERMNVYAYIAIVDVFLKLGIAYVVYIVPNDKLIWYAAMMLVITCAMLVFYYIYVRLNFHHLYFQKVRDRNLFSSLLGFSGWSLVGNIAYIGYTQGLNMLLNVFFGPIVNAARSISLQIEQSVRTFVNNFQTAINPQIIKNYAQNDFEQMHSLMFRSSKFSVFLLLFFAVPIVLETDMILELWLKEVPEYTANFCRIMFLIIALEAMTNSIGIGVVATGNIKWYHILVGTLLMMIIPISYVVLKAGASPESVFLVYLFFEILAVFTRLFVASKSIDISITKFITQVFSKCIGVSLVALLIPIVLHFIMEPGIIRLLIVAVVSVICNAISIYFLGLTSNERKLLSKIINKKFHL